jgi:hypothetical protein
VVGAFEGPITLTSTRATLRVPKDLEELDQWLLWRREQVGKRETKVPYSIQGRKASSTDPRAWTSFELAQKAWRASPRMYAGLGFVFVKSGGLVGIDLDDCLDSDGDVKVWARGTVERFSDSYMEISPSGSGLKIWARGELAANVPGVAIGDGRIEMYDHARFFTVTGRAFRGAALQIEDHAADLILLFEHLTAPTKRKVWPLQPLQGGRIPYGQQHSTLVSIAGTLRARRVCEQAVLACLLAINEHQLERPAPPENIARIVKSTRSWGAR